MEEYNITKIEAVFNLPQRRIAMKKTSYSIAENHLKNLFKNKNNKPLSYLKEIKLVNETVIIRFTGDIDAQTIPIIMANCGHSKCRIQAIDKNIILDFKDVRKVDSSTLAFLVHLLREHKEKNKKIVLINMSPLLEKYLVLAKLDSYIQTYNDEKSALAAFK